MNNYLNKAQSLHQVKIGLFFAVLCFGALFPVFVKSVRWLTTANVMFYYIMLATSWNLLMGYTGLFSFAHVAFAGVGAYTSTLLALHYSIAPALGIVIAGLATALLGALLGVLVLRLRGFYLCLVTWAVAVIIQTLLATQYKLTGGTGGIFAPSLFRSVSEIPYYYVGFGISILMIISVYFLVKSKIGLKFRAIRDDEDAANSLGINTTKWKIVSFIIGSFWVGVAGSYYAHYITMVDPSIVGLDEMGKVILMVVIGGYGTVVGPVVGAVFVTFAAEYIRGSLATISMLIFALLMILTARFARGGLTEISQRFYRFLKRGVNT